MLKKLCSMDPPVSTRFLILSDTHGDALNHPLTEKADVVIHCGDLTEESKLEEFKTALHLLKQFDAPLKLVIAGNHDFTLDKASFSKKIDDFKSTYGNESLLLDREFGAQGAARRLFESEDAKNAGIMFLDEGVHRIPLVNGTTLTVYASPYTPSLSDMGFQYNPKKEEHDWAIDGSVDVVITHGPPQGILDHTGRERAGSPSLFKAVAQAKPRLHCFGHIHEAWGAKLVTWRDDLGEEPTHFTAIDNNKSVVIDSLASTKPGKFDSPEMKTEKLLLREKVDAKGYCTATQSPALNLQTLFVNAAIEGPTDELQQWPWMVDLTLPKTDRKGKRKSDDREATAAGDTKKRCRS